MMEENCFAFLNLPPGKLEPVWMVGDKMIIAWHPSCFPSSTGTCWSGVSPQLHSTPFWMPHGRGNWQSPGPILVGNRIPVISNLGRQAPPGVWIKPFPLFFWKPWETAGLLWGGMSGEPLEPPQPPSPLTLPFKAEICQHNN